MKSIRRLFGLLAAILLFTTSLAVSPASAVPTTISGSVIDNTETGISAVFIELLNTSENVVASTQTDTNGEFVVTVEPGNYDVQLETSSGRAATIEDVEFRDGAPVTIVLYPEGELTEVTFDAELLLDGQPLPIDSVGASVNLGNGASATRHTQGSVVTVPVFAGSDITYNAWVDHNGQRWRFNSSQSTAINGPTTINLSGEIAEVTFRIVEPDGTALTGWYIYAPTDNTQITTPNFTGDSGGIEARDSADGINDGQAKILMPLGIKGSTYYPGRIVLANGLSLEGFTLPHIRTPNSTIILIPGPEGATVIVDSDSDGIPDTEDNCPITANADQGDVDADGIGDVCDDHTPPDVTGSLNPSENGAGWLNDANAVIEWSATDPGFSLGPDEFVIADTAPLDEGVNVYISPEVCDNQGNCSTGTYEVKLDLTAPELTLNAPADGSEVFQSNYVPPTCTASDALSGLDGDCALTISAPTNIPGAVIYTATATASDLAGNTTTLSSTYAVVFDTEGPVVAATYPPANEHGWWNEPVTVTFTCTDEESGVATCPDPITFDSEGSGQTATVTAEDNAGNTTEFVVAGINIDLTDPTVEFVGAKTLYQIDETITIDCQASDALSGIADSDCKDVNIAAYDYVAWLLQEGEITTDPGSVTGTFTRSATATDRADNSTTTTISFEIAVTPASLKALLIDLIGENGNPGLFNNLDNYTGFVSQVNALCCTDEPTGNGNGNSQGNGPLFTSDEAALLIELATTIETNGTTIG